MTVLRDVRFNSPMPRINIALGTIVRDDKGRFNPGDEIITSIVKDFGTDFIQTLNTRYEVENWINGKPKED